jgi:hypothetical protein
MADKKITQLTPLSVADSNDVLPIVDVGTPETKKITITNIFGSPTAIGSVTPNSAVFTTLEVGGVQIDEFSTDGTLSGDSDTALPTEKAVKTYVDNAVSGVSGNKIIQNDTAVIITDDGTSAGIINIIADGTGVGNYTLNGLILTSGSRINEFSNDSNLTDGSATAVPTEKAVKDYVDSRITDADNVRRVFSDTTAQVNDVLLVDTTTGHVNIQMLSNRNGRIIVKKISDDWNDVIITTTSGTIDGANQITIETKNQTYNFIVDNGDFFII